MLKQRWFPSEKGITKNSNGTVYTTNIVNKIGKIVCKVNGRTEEECASIGRHILYLHNCTLDKT